MIILPSFPPTLLGARLQVCPSLFTPTETFEDGPASESCGLSAGAPSSVLVGLGAQVASALSVGACTLALRRSHSLFASPDSMSYSPTYLFYFFTFTTFLSLPELFANKHFTFFFFLLFNLDIGLSSATSILKFDVSNIFT